jgi:hypothetical protein
MAIKWNYLVTRGRDNLSRWLDDQHISPEGPANRVEPGGQVFILLFWRRSNHHRKPNYHRCLSFPIIRYLWVDAHQFDAPWFPDASQKRYWRGKSREKYDLRVQSVFALGCTAQRTKIRIFDCVCNPAVPTIHTKNSQGYRFLFEATVVALNLINT